MEYDGISWREIPVPNLSVRSLAVDAEGIVYVGGVNEMGLLSPDSKGTLTYTSLVGHLEEENRNFAQVWRTYSTKQGICSWTSKYLFLWDFKQVKVWKADSFFDACFLCKGKLYIRQRGVGLLEMKGGSLELIPGGEGFAVENLYMLVSYDSRRLLCGTKGNGIFIYDGKGAVPFPTEANDYLQEKELYHGIRLSSGDYALATRRGGLVVIDSHGGLKYIFDKSSGLQDDSVKYVFEDNQGNLWLALDEGITKIEYASPISIYDNRSNLPGNVLSVVRHGPDSDLFVGTTRGLYYLASSPAGFKGKFRPVPGISSYCWDLLSVGKSLLAATDEGVLQIENNKKTIIIKDWSFVLYPSRKDKNRTWLGTVSGLVALSLKKETGQWERELQFENITDEIRTVVEDGQGNLWLGIRAKGVLKVDFPGGGTIFPPDVMPYDTSHGLPPGEIQVFTAAGHVIFASEHGIFRFDEKNRVFIPDHTLGDEFAGGENAGGVFRLVQDRKKNIWFHSNARNIQGIPQPDGTFVIDREPFLRIPLSQVNTIYLDPYYHGELIWFASNDGLIRYDTEIKKNYGLDFQTLIRKVLVNGKLVFNGCKSNNRPSIIPFEDRNLRFEFAAPFFEAETETQYQCLLEGYDNNWTAWNRETRKDYTNLDAGRYTFRVRARNVYENVSREDVFQFKVLPPWYKTWWAFLIYAIAAFFMVFFIVKWRSQKLVKEKQRLEQIIKNRTKEIVEKSRQLEEQSEKLKEMDKVKARFFANISHEFRTPLTLIMGPLEQMISGPRESDQEQKKKMQLMLRNSQRLLNLINQLLELSRLDSGTIKLRASRQNIVPFLRGILHSFDSLAVQNEVELKFQTEAEVIPLYFDPEKLEEVIANLLSNAVKFTPAGGRITLAVNLSKALPGTGKQDFLEVSVSDTGPGIPREQLANIFDRFYQADSTYEHHRKGSGIGLAIAREMVELHHGTISVQNREYGGGDSGTQFVIRLPMGDAHLEPREICDVPPAPPEPRRIDKIPVPEVMEKEEEEEEETEQTGSEAGDQKNIILVVEDSADVRQYIRDTLEPFYTVKEAKDGEEGIQKAREIIPDLIICDIMMPGIDGYEACRTLKKDIATSHIPVILLTAKAAEENIVQGLECGADDYITKPFSTKILSVRVRNLIDLRRHLQETWNREMSLQPTGMAISEVDKEFMKELKKVMEENISETDFNVDQLGRKLYMSHATLYRKIHALTGETPTEFIRSYRLKRGAELLKKGVGTVLEVAFEVGFSSANYFTKCFKQKFHQLPTDFKENE